MVVQPLKSSQAQFICQVLLDTATFNDYTLLCRILTVLIGPPGTAKMKTILALIAVTYCMSNYVARSAIQFELLRRR